MVTSTPSARAIQAAGCDQKAAMQELRLEWQLGKRLRRTTQRKRLVWHVVALQRSLAVSHRITLVAGSARTPAVRERAPSI
jgi:hypothetical protein